MKISSFSIILSFVVLMLIGTAMVPLVNIGEKPQIEQRKNIIITYGWPNMAAKVVEQNVTSTMEGVISSIKGWNVLALLHTLVAVRFKLP